MDQNWARWNGVSLFRKVFLFAPRKNRILRTNTKHMLSGNTEKKIWNDWIAICYHMLSRDWIKKGFMYFCLFNDLVASECKFDDASGRNIVFKCMFQNGNSQIL